MGFLFLVLYPLLPLPPVHTHTHPSLTHTSLPHTHNTYSLTHSHTHIPHSHTHITDSHTHIPQTLTQDNVRCQGVRCTPRCPSGVPWSPPLCRWLLRGRRGTMCTAKGSVVRPGVPLASLGLRRSAGGFCVAGVGQCGVPRGRMYLKSCFFCKELTN